MTTVIIDNYDSFTYNLVQYVGEIMGSDTRPIVFRNDEVSIEDLRRHSPNRIIISPGPGSPEDRTYFGVCTEVIRELGTTVPLLGVCLGHQGIIHAFGGRILRAPLPMHGKTSEIFHSDTGVFRGLPRPFKAMRYHSLIGDAMTLPPCLEITAKTEDGLIMGVQHRSFPIHGIQFHPESIGTAVGKRLLQSFLSEKLQ